MGAVTEVDPGDDGHDGALVAQEAHHRGVPAPGRQGDGREVGALLVDVPAAGHQRRHQGEVPELGRHHEGRARPAIRRVRIHPRDQSGDGVGLTPPDGLGERRHVVLAHVADDSTAALADRAQARAAFR